MGLNIAIDLDGVIFDWQQTFINYFNVRNSCNFLQADVYKWEIWDCFGISKDEFSQICKEFNDERMWQSVEPYRFAKETICALVSKGHNIYYITARHKAASRSTIKSIMSNGFPIESILFCKKDEKAELSKKLKIDIAIDDCPYTIESYVKNDICAVMPLRIYNKNYEFKLDKERKDAIIKIDDIRKFVGIVENREAKI